MLRTTVGLSLNTANVTHQSMKLLCCAWASIALNAGQCRIVWEPYPFSSLKLYMYDALLQS